MLTRILVPLDGSLLAQTALDVVRRIADVKTEIILMTAIQLPEYSISGIDPMISIDWGDHPTLDSIRIDATRYLHELARKLQQEGFRARPYIEVGDASSSIVRIANMLDVDMIVMSTHGRSGVSRWLYGSVTGGVLALSSRPVVVVPNHEFQQHERKLAEMNSLELE